MLYRLMTLAAALLISGVAPASDIYRSTDAQGNVIYSDRPDDIDQEPLIRTAGRVQLQQPSEPEPVRDNDSDDDDAPANPMDALCDQAKVIRDRYESSSRIAEQKEDGTLRTLSDEEMRVAIIRAREDVTRFCGSDD